MMVMWLSPPEMEASAVVVLSCQIKHVRAALGSSPKDRRPALLNPERPRRLAGPIAQQRHKMRVARVRGVNEIIAGRQPQRTLGQDLEPALGHGGSDIG